MDDERIDLAPDVSPPDAAEPAGDPVAEVPATDPAAVARPPRPSRLPLVEIIAPRGTMPRDLSRPYLPPPLVTPSFRASDYRVRFRRLPSLLRLVVNAFSSLIIGAIVVYAAINAYASLGVGRYFIVGGNSMLPAVPFGSVVLSTPVVPEEIRAGDVVTYRAPNQVYVTHRVVEVTTDETGELAFRTKGDNVLDPDPWLVLPEQIAGRDDTFAPWLGFLFLYLSYPSGLLSAFAFIGSLQITDRILRELAEESELRRRAAELAAVEAVEQA